MAVESESRPVTAPGVEKPAGPGNRPWTWDGPPGRLWYVILVGDLGAVLWSVSDPGGNTFLGLPAGLVLCLLGLVWLVRLIRWAIARDWAVALEWFLAPALVLTAFWAIGHRYPLPATGAFWCYTGGVRFLR